MAITLGTVQLYIVSLLGLSGAVGFQFPKDGPACIIVNMNATLFLTITEKNPSTVTSNLTNAVVNEGLCADNGTYSATLNLDTSGQIPATLSFVFAKTVNNEVFMNIMVIFVPNDIFKNRDTEKVITHDNGKIGLSGDNFSYNCTDEREILFVPKNSTMFTYNFTMTVSNVVIQAFNIRNGKLSEAEYCQVEQSTTVEATTPGLTSDEETTQPNEPTGSTSGMTTIEIITSTTEIATTEVASSATVMPTTPFITPAPGNPHVQTYSVEGENGTCILMTVGIQFIIKYNATNGQKTKILDIPPLHHLTVKGNCDNTQTKEPIQSIDIMFYDNWNLQIKFSTDKDEKYYLSEIDLTANLNTELFPDIESPGLQKIVKMLNDKKKSASVHGSYKCTEKLEFKLNQDFSMYTIDLQFAAFQKNITNFKDTDVFHCEEKKGLTTWNIVEIVVVVVVVVAVAFLVHVYFKRKRRRRNYKTINGRSEGFNTG